MLSVFVSNFRFCSRLVTSEQPAIELPSPLKVSYPGVHPAHQPISDNQFAPHSSIQQNSNLASNPEDHNPDSPSTGASKSAHLQSEALLAPESEAKDPLLPKDSGSPAEQHSVKMEKVGRRDVDSNPTQPTGSKGKRTTLPWNITDIITEGYDARLRPNFGMRESFKVF